MGRQKKAPSLANCFGMAEHPNCCAIGIEKRQLVKKTNRNCDVFRVDEFWFWWDGCYSFLGDLRRISLYMGSSILILNSAAPNEHTVGDTPKWSDQWSSLYKRYTLDYWVNTQWSFWDAHNFGRQLYMKPLMLNMKPFTSQRVFHHWLFLLMTRPKGTGLPSTCVQFFWKIKISEIHVKHISYKMAQDSSEKMDVSGLFFKVSEYFFRPRKKKTKPELEKDDLQKGIT